MLRTGADGTTALSTITDGYDADDEDATQTLTGSPTTADTEADASLDVSGDDAKYFDITNEGVLSIDEDQVETDEDDTDFLPNFEDKSSYSITIVATSGVDTRLRRTSLDVTVHVIDAEDVGTVSLTAREPQVGRTVVATVSDPDGGVTLSRWTWATSNTITETQTCAGDATTFMDVTPDVSSGAYTPKAADADKCLRATATYMDNIPGDAAPTADTMDNDDDLATGANIDGIDVAKVSEEPVQISDPANTAPKFADQDLSVEGDQSDEASRSVAENMDDETVGNPVNGLGR